MTFERIRINRRTLLKLGAATATGGLGLAACSSSDSSDFTPPPKLQAYTGKDGQTLQPWSNWSGNQQCAPNTWLTPSSTDELAAMIRQSEQGIRLVGAGHSFSGLVPTDKSLMSLAYFYGVDNIDKEKKQVTIAANTFLSGVGDEMWENGLGLINMPDINTQTFGGAIATSTHGTGQTLGSMSSDVTKLALVNGRGEPLTCSASENTELFHAARTGLGALGAVTHITMQARDKYYLKETNWMMDLEEGLERAEELRQKHRHFELFALPHADYILGVTLDEISADNIPPPQENEGDAYETFKTLSDLIDKLPFMRSFILNTGASTVGEEIRGGRSYDIFGNLRDIRFNEMEYSVPAEHGIACLNEILTTIKKHDIDVIFPIEVRFVKGDDIWLSPFYQRDTCAISCHNFHDKDYKKYFAAIEPIFWKYDGRPHWGKIHNLTATELQARYDRFGDFLRVRAEMDPKGLFINDHVSRVLGLG